MKPLHIIGGGVAGLALGIALRQAGAPVTITEGSDYPRHRVCGEFISGAGRQVLESFGLADLLAGAACNTRTAWYGGNRPLFAASLPAPAFGLSRFQLDQRLAECFRRLGGKLVTRTPVRTAPAEAGTVWACGRRGTLRGWIGLKLHCRGIEPVHDLSMHFGSRGYVGVSRIEEGKTNICGLFQLRRELAPGKARILPAYLRANGLSLLADRVEAAEIDPASITSTTALDFTAHPWPPVAVCIGDSNTAIPPFAGNGISMALESARAALPPLLDYATGSRPWAEARVAVQAALQESFQPRLATARFLHPFLLHLSGRRPLGWLITWRILPFHLLYRLLR